MKTYSPSEEKGIQIFLMEKEEFLVKEELICFEQITEPAYVRNFIALIITVIFCLFLFRAI